METKRKLSNQEELFKQECKVINLRYEYVGYKGDIPYAIVSGLSESELQEKYPDIICKYTPFVHLSIEQGIVIHESNQDEDTYSKFVKRHCDLFGYEEGITEILHPEFYIDYEDTLDKILRDEMEALQEIKRQEQIAKVRDTLSSMKEIQRMRLIKNVIYGMSSRKIAEEEGVNFSAVYKSIKAAKKNFKKKYNKF